MNMNIYIYILAKAGSRRYLAQTIKDSDQVNDIVLLANTPARAKSLLHSLEKAAGGIDVHVNDDKTKYLSFNQNQKGDISILKSASLKLVDKFTYLGSSVSSTENDINTWQAKTWTAIDWLSASYIEQILEATSHKSAATQPTPSHL